MYQGKTILVWGMGVSGKSAATYLLSQGASVIAVDKKSCDGVLEESAPLPWDKIDLVVKSPGIAPTHPLALEAKRRSVPVVCDVELALRVVQKKVVAITGSNGKTTTTLLVAHILCSAGIKALAVGNIGVPILSMLAMDADVLVLELSSFQLETIETSTLEGALILNITENHLDRYTSFEAYAAAKLSIIDRLKEGKKAFISSGAEKFLSFTHKEKVATFFSLSYREELFPATAHDGENAGGAWALVKEMGVSKEQFESALLTFCKPPHRLEPVRVWQGVRYVNDSKATSVDAVVRAVETFSAKVVLIAGGVDKGGDYTPWRAVFRERVKLLLLIGAATDKIAAILGDVCKIEQVGTLDRAVERASEEACAGQVVLFSPGCSSYDQFLNFEHRGSVFKQLVAQLKRKEEGV